MPGVLLFATNGLIAAPFATTTFPATVGFFDQSSFQRRRAEEARILEAFTSTTQIRTTQSWGETSVSQEAHLFLKYRVLRWKPAR
jgi:hypothetical protein